VKLPLLGGFQTGFMIEGRPKPEPGKGTFHGYFPRNTWRVEKRWEFSLLQGRYFSAADNETSESVCIIDATMAQTQWPGENPIGKHAAVFGRNSVRIILIG